MIKCSILLHEEQRMFDVTQRPAPDDPDVDSKEQPEMNHCDYWNSCERVSATLHR
jgi:hypothetical protein